MTWPRPGGLIPPLATTRIVARLSNGLLSRLCPSLHSLTSNGSPSKSRFQALRVEIAFSLKARKFSSVSARARDRDDLGRRTQERARLALGDGGVVCAKEREGSKQASMATRWCPGSAGRRCDVATFGHGGGVPLNRRRRAARRGDGSALVRAKSGGDDDELYDYSTEKVRSLLKRDSKELKGFEDLGESAQAFQPSTSDEPKPSPSKPESPFGGGAAAPKPSKAAPQSPFASTSASGAGKKSPPPQSPFGGAGGSGTSTGSLGSISKQKLMSPFKADAQSVDVQTNYEDNDRPWWQPQITLTQIVLAISFSLLVVLMLGTFSIVLKSGAIRFNDT